MKLPTTLLLSSLLAGTSHAALYTSGHADVFGIGYVDENTPGVFELEPHIHAENATIDGVVVSDAEYEPGEITVVVPQSTYNFVIANGGRPADPAYEAIGVAAGQGYWFLPSDSSLSATLNAPFAGVGTEELVATDWNGPLSIMLNSVSGPGEFSMWVDGFAPNFAISSSDGTDSFDIAAGTHAHYNWGFTAEGIYDITVTVSGDHITDGLKEATATYQFAVIPEPSSALFTLASGLLLFRRKR